MAIPSYTPQFHDVAIFNTSHDFSQNRLISCIRAGIRPATLSVVSLYLGRSISIRRNVMHSSESLVHAEMI
jgi:hypothetical protein